MVATKSVPHALWQRLLLHSSAQPLEEHLPSALEVSSENTERTSSAILGYIYLGEGALLTVHSIEKHAPFVVCIFAVMHFCRDAFLRKNCWFSCIIQRLTARNISVPAIALIGNNTVATKNVTMNCRIHCRMYAVAPARTERVE